MDAQCNACGGRVMPYFRYAGHFRRTAVCESCGNRVRIRRYRTVLATTFALVALVALPVYLTRSIPVAATALALGTLLGLLADFWTFRNLSWDLDADDASRPDGSATVAPAHHAPPDPSRSRSGAGR